MDLIKTERLWRTTIPITCEGSGEILIELTDGRQTSCPVGYVSWGWEKFWKYEITDGNCSWQASNIPEEIPIEEEVVEPWPFEQKQN